MKYSREISISLALILGFVAGAFVFGGLAKRPVSQPKPDLSEFQGTWIKAARKLTWDDVTVPIDPKTKKPLPPKLTFDYPTAADFFLIPVAPGKTNHETVVIGPNSITRFSDDGRCSTWLCTVHDHGDKWAVFERDISQKVMPGRLELTNDGLLTFDGDHYLRKPEED